MEISPEVIAFVGILLACIFRTTLPYWKKHKGDATLKFEWKYVASFIAVVFIGTATAILIFPAFTFPESSYLYIFTTAFAYGWASDDIIDKLLTKTKK